ncbi:hypothetical protein BMS3Bbin04_00035 [bacterium BMS3Bbin04]|nr:hypothetical protein BMS3Bbin04_00035 [bacterium BMS3Bbin04]
MSIRPILRTTFTLLFVLLTLSVSTLSLAQVSTYSYVSTVIGDGSRYEIIQSPLLRKLTFKLDKRNGFVYQLTLKNDGSTGWATMNVIARDKTLIAGDQSFQIYCSGTMARDTFMLNIHDGTTWNLVEDTDTSDLFWSIVPH